MATTMSNICDFCGAAFTRKANLKLHIQRRHERESAGAQSRSAFDCPFCSSIFDTREEIGDHVRADHDELLTFQKISAINNKIVIFRRNLIMEKQSLADFCHSKRALSEIFNLIKFELTKRSAFRISVVITANYELPELSENGRSADNDTFSLRTKGEVINEFESDRKIKRKIKTLLQGAIDREEDLLTRGSGWCFENLQSCDVLFYDLQYI